MQFSDITNILQSLAPWAGIAGFVASVALLLVQQKFKNDLESLRSNLQNELSEKSAFRSYQFEARKRLYNECEPIFFQMFEASEMALRKIDELLDTKNQKHLVAENDFCNPSNPQWILNRSSHLVSILHSLISPASLFLMLREKITLFDCALDETVLTRYIIMKELYYIFQSDFKMAEIEPAINQYDPRAQAWRHKRKEDPKHFWWQGMTPGRLERAAHLFIMNDNGVKRLITYGEFEDLYHKIDSGSDNNMKKIIGLAANPLYGFNLIDRPVFIRVLLAQVYMHCIFMHVSMREASAGELQKIIGSFSDCSNPCLTRHTESLRNIQALLKSFDQSANVNILNHINKRISGLIVQRSSPN